MSDSSKHSEFKDRQKNRAFFGRRKGPQLSPARKTLIDTLLPELAIDTRSQPPRDLKHLFGEVAVFIEIGFGGGEHLIHEAQRLPDTGFIGVEPYINSMAKMLSVLKSGEINNIQLYDDDATLLLDWLPAQSISRIDLLYPDPWPKKRHWKRRFVNPENLDRMARVLKPGGVFRFASDIGDYVNWALNQCDRHPAFNWTVECADDWRKPWPHWSPTRYEAKAMRENRAPCYLVFNRV